MKRAWIMRYGAACVGLSVLASACALDETDIGEAELAVIDMNVAWERHTIVAGGPGLVGSDGVHLADMNNDGRHDVVSPYEQSGKVTVSLHPGYLQADNAWGTPVTLPAGADTIVSAEDAIIADVDGDGRKDVIVGSEDGNRVTVMFAPADLIMGSWVRMDLLTGFGVMRVAFANVAGEVARPGKAEIVIGGREKNGPEASIGYYSLTTPASPRLASSWTYNFIRRVSWVMNMMVVDMEGDGDRDIVYTDREQLPGDPPDGSKRGLRWITSSNNNTPAWTDAAPYNQISSLTSNHKWFDIIKWDADNDLDIVDCRSDGATEDYKIWLNGGAGMSWTSLTVPVPTSVGDCQHITFANVDKAGALDLGITYSHSEGLFGVLWMQNTGTAAAPVWQRGRISGNGADGGIKFDNLIWYDMDNDTDLDAVTSEQHEPAGTSQGPGLGVIWYENPLIAAP